MNIDSKNFTIMRPVPYRCSVSSSTAKLSIQKRQQKVYDWLVKNQQYEDDGEDVDVIPFDQPNQEMAEMVHKTDKTTLIKQPVNEEKENVNFADGEDLEPVSVSTCGNFNNFNEHLVRLVEIDRQLLEFYTIPPEENTLAMKLKRILLKQQREEFMEQLNAPNSMKS